MCKWISMIQWTKSPCMHQKETKSINASLTKRPISSLELLVPRTKSRSTNFSNDIPPSSSSESTSNELRHELQSNVDVRVPAIESASDMTVHEWSSFKSPQAAVASAFSLLSSPVMFTAETWLLVGLTLGLTRGVWLSTRTVLYHLNDLNLCWSRSHLYYVKLIRWRCRCIGGLRTLRGDIVGANLDAWIGRGAGDIIACTGST